MAKKTPIIIVSLVAIASAIYGGREYLYSRSHIVTDNAQIDGPLIPIAAKLQAFVLEVRALDNQAVKAGDTLLVLDARDLDAKIAQAEADLNVALAMAGNGQHAGQLKAQLDAASATAAGTEATIASAQAALRKATADLERVRGLAAKQIVPAQQLDAAQAAFDGAKAVLDATQRQRTAATAQVAAASAALDGADARVAAARASLNNIKVQRAWAVVTAPVDGVVSRRMIEPGALAQPGQTAMMLVPNDQLWITANVKETRLGKIVVNDSVTFTIDSYGSHKFRGRVMSISPATGARFAILPPDNATGNYTKVVQNVPVQVEVAQPIDPKYPLRRGMSVEVTITTGK
jgi:membrane fusion protein (multidrug efflux system)